MNEFQAGQQVAAEVVRLHEFFVRWLGGTSGTLDGVGKAEDWADFEASLHSNFEMVVPSGDTLTRSELLHNFKPAFGTRPGLRIEIRETKVLDVNGDSILMRYQEWQEFMAPVTGSESTGETETITARVSMALLQRSTKAPVGWQWLQLQETWLAAQLNMKLVGHKACCP